MEISVENVGPCGNSFCTDQIINTCNIPIHLWWNNTCFNEFHLTGWDHAIASRHAFQHSCETRKNEMSEYYLVIWYLNSLYHFLNHFLCCTINHWAASVCIIFWLVGNDFGSINAKSMKIFKWDVWQRVWYSHVVFHWSVFVETSMCMCVCVSSITKSQNSLKQNFIANTNTSKTDHKRRKSQKKQR